MCSLPLLSPVRDVFDHAFNVLGERSMKVDWSSFIVKNVISNLNYLLRIYRLTEQELNAHNPFFAQTPEAAKHNILKAELLRNYKLHVAVQQPLAYQRKLSTAILSRILKSNDFRSETVRSLTRECLTAYVFFPTMGFVDPYWVNYGITCALRGTATKADEADAEDGEAGAAAAPGKAEPSASSKSEKTKKHSSKTPGNSTTYEKVGYASLSTPSSRSTSPERSSAEPSSNGPDASASSISASMAGAPSALAVTDTDWAEHPPAPVMARKESILLTSKMKAWDAEKQKRQEKRTARKAKHLIHSNSMGGDLSSSGMGQGLPHDDEVPTGLLSPQGAFSHSPNHAISPTALNSVPPSPSQLSSNWEVRIIGAGIRFDPKPFVMYQLLVKNGPSLKWTVVKRYSAFEELHAKLKKAIPSFEAQLPKKHFFGNLDQQFIANRKVELQTYLGQLLWNRTVQENADLQAFLLPSPEDAKWTQQNPQQNGGQQSGSTFSFFKNKKEKDEAAAAQAAAAAPSAAGPNEDGDTFTSSDPRATDSPRTTRRDRQAAASSGDASTGAAAAPSASPPLSPASSKAQLPRTYSADDLSNGSSKSRGTGSAAATSAATASSASSSAAAATAANPFPLATGPGPSIPGAKEGTWEDKSLTDPLYMLVEEVFNLNGRGWMRRQTAWVAKNLVKLTMDSLIKDKLNKSVESWMNEDVVSEHFDWICDIIWPKGVLYTPAAPPDATETLRMKLEAQEMMRHSIPTALRAMLGKEHCLAAMENFFQFLQMEPLIQHFVRETQQHAGDRARDRMCDSHAALALLSCCNVCRPTLWWTL